MSSYIFCNQILASTIYLSELTSVANSAPNLEFNLEKQRKQMANLPWLHHWDTPVGGKSISYSQIEDMHLLRFPSLADFVISSAAKQITCYPTPDTPIETLRHLLLDQVLPRCLAHQGMLMLHASAVALEHGVVLFLGSTGEGKSTLAGYFHQSGAQAISDDCVRLLDDQGSVEVIPSYGGLRLWQDARQFLFPEMQDSSPVAHYSSKQRLLLEADQPPTLEKIQPAYPILAVIVLSSTSENSDAAPVRLESIPRRQAFIEAMQQTFLLDVTDRQRYTRLMQSLGEIVLKLRFLKLTLPHRFDALPQARQLILDALG